MAVPAGTVQTFNRVGIRESLSDMISNIDPTDTVFTSAIGRKSGWMTVTQTLSEWQIDSFRAAAQNAALPGDDASFQEPAKTVKLGNYTQISRETSVVAGTMEAVVAAGRKSEVNYQLLKRSMELKRDIEFIFLQNTAGVAAASGAKPYIASLAAYVKTNTNKGTGGVDPNYTSGVPSGTRTDAIDANLRAFTETQLKDVLQQCWTNGAKPGVLMVGGYNKMVASTFTGIATRNFDMSNVAPKATAVIGAIDIYVSDFSIIRVIPNRFQRVRDAWLIDWNMIGRRDLRSYQVSRLGKTGDNIKHMILTEYTLGVKNEKGLGLVADLTSSA